jgi:hypothetical protein
MNYDDFSICPRRSIVKHDGGAVYIAVKKPGMMQYAKKLLSSEDHLLFRQIANAGEVSTAKSDTETAVKLRGLKQSRNYQ